MISQHSLTTCTQSRQLTIHFTIRQPDVLHFSRFMAYILYIRLKPLYITMISLKPTQYVPLDYNF
jgi:hypothetical protein